MANFKPYPGNMSIQQHTTPMGGFEPMRFKCSSIAKEASQRHSLALSDRRSSIGAENGSILSSRTRQVGSQSSHRGAIKFELSRSTKGSQTAVDELGSTKQVVQLSARIQENSCPPDSRRDFSETREQQALDFQVTLPDAEAEFRNDTSKSYWAWCEIKENWYHGPSPERAEIWYPKEWLMADNGA